ncbi:MAG: Gfo/Idh/MocA family protein, partial [Puniceicoccales bacterium]
MKTLPQQPSAPVRLLLVGIGGYGAIHLRHIQSLQKEEKVILDAVVDPFPDRAADWPKLQKEGIPAFPTLEDYLSQRSPAELAIICSPIPYHADQTDAALKAGMNVLCEKPIAATLSDARRMEASARSHPDQFLEIGYQWSFSHSIQALKQDILNGDLGAPLRLRTRVAWPRTDAYYNRNNWAGRNYTPQGQPVFDNPVSNATAHYLHNMLYLCGPAMDQSALPIRMEAECYRANPIETFDAACCRINTREGAEILFYTAHCASETDGPAFFFEFENGE